MLYGGPYLQGVHRANINLQPIILKKRTEILPGEKEKDHLLKKYMFNYEIIIILY